MFYMLPTAQNYLSQIMCMCEFAKLEHPGYKSVNTILSFNYPAC